MGFIFEKNKDDSFEAFKKKKTFAKKFKMKKTQTSFL